MSATHGTHWLDREDFGPVTVVRLKTHRLDGEAAVHDHGIPGKRLGSAIGL